MWRIWASNWIKMSSQQEPLPTEKWQAARIWFLPSFLLSGAHMTEYTVTAGSRRATWEQRHTVADTCGPSKVFKGQKGWSERWSVSPGLVLVYCTTQGSWPCLPCLYSYHLLELTPDVHPARIIPSLSLQAAGICQEQRIEQKVLKDNSVFPLWRGILQSL